MLVLRKEKPKVLEDLTLYELNAIFSQFTIEDTFYDFTKDKVIYCVSFTSEQYLEIINYIEDDNFQNIDLDDKQMIRHCQEILTLVIGFGIINEDFRTNFIKRLKNRDILLEKAYFIQLTFADLNYYLCSSFGNHYSVTTYDNKRYIIEYCRNGVCTFVHNNDWSSGGFPVDSSISYTLNRYRNGISFIRQLYYIMVINQFDLDNDIKWYIKEFFNYSTFKDLKII